MLTLRTISLVLLLGWLSPGSAQLLSPGELAKPHAEIEGLRNCTQCHSAGQKVPEENCLACHETLAARIQEKAGYHSQVQGDCVDCHSDHRGVDYQMIRWDSANFDHDSTGYALTGKHLGIECADCHKQPNTFLGLQSDCLSCHTDEHQRQLGEDCLSCHSMDGWQPVTGFSHADSRFPLAGRHEEVDCEKCHATEADDAGEQFSRYRPLAFAACADCHADEHRGQFATQQCTACHTVDGFKPATIDHQRFRFPLLGRHASVECEACHKPTTAADGDSMIAYRPVAFAACADCHTDPHAGQFQEDCSSCHNVEGFQQAPIDHEQTRFPLRGQHRDVTCVACHGPPPGAPAGTPAIFRGLNFATCNDCHVDVHAGQFEQDCTSCHQVDGWKIAAFDHGRTRFALQGKHAAVACFDCHKLEEADNPQPLRRWRGFAHRDCADCHTDYHVEQFDKDCVTCHTNDDFIPSTFDHQQAIFPLDGAHIPVPCLECHKPFSIADGTQRIRYRPISGDCGTCHG